MKLDNIFFQLYIGSIFLIAATAIIIYMRNKSNKDGWVFIGYMTLFFSLFICYRASGLIFFSEKVTGITKGITHGYKSGSSVNFEYMYKGSHKSGSNSMPLSTDSIRIENGKYVVYVFNGFRQFSWMDFSQPVN